MAIQAMDVTLSTVPGRVTVAVPATLSVGGTVIGANVTSVTGVSFHVDQPPALTPVEQLPQDQRDLLVGYLTAKQQVVAAGFERDILWAESIACGSRDSKQTLTEYAWVVVNSGFRYKTVVKLWPRFTEAFYDFDVDFVGEDCRPRALRVLNHQRKVNAILEAAKMIREGRHHEWPALATRDPLLLTRLPYIGPVTCYHLAKMLRVDCVKPDVHLRRASESATWVGKPPVYRKHGLWVGEVFQFCRRLSTLAGDRLTVIDSVLWRWGEMNQATAADWRRLWAG